jgi:hypothetical protein
MAFATGNSSISLAELKKKVSDADLVFHYLGIKRVPCIINSPLRKDTHPSFGLYSKDGKKISWVDFATKDKGSIYDLLCKMWHCSFKDMLNRIAKNIDKLNESASINKHIPCEVVSTESSDTELQVKVREWRDYDIEYWQSYGVSLEWLNYAEVYPISHMIWIKGDNRYVMSAYKYAYAFVEHKEGKDTIKVYQPLGERKRKWVNKHDRSVISLWTKIPEYGDKLVICSSLKDALCLWSNTGIPAIALQGEGYGISNTALQELKRRYKQIYILFDNDEAGLADGEKLAAQTGFTNVVLPPFNNGKDVSDLYKVCTKEKFLSTISTILDIENDTLSNDQN